MSCLDSAGVGGWEFIKGENGPGRGKEDGCEKDGDRTYRWQGVSELGLEGGGGQCWGEKSAGGAPARRPILTLSFTWAPQSLQQTSEQHLHEGLTESPFWKLPRRLPRTGNIGASRAPFIMKTDMLLFWL